jgi:hypothetical protein
MAAHLDDVTRVIELPEFREPDPRVGRERYFGRRGPMRWLRVVTEFAGRTDRVVTAIPQDNEPDGGEQTS